MTAEAHVVIPQEHIPADSPQGWIAQQIEDPDVYHFKIEGREKAGDRWGVKCDIRRKPDDTAADIHDRVSRECDRQNCIELRVIVTTRQSRTPLSTFPWASDFLGNPDADESIGNESTSPGDALMRQTLRRNEAILGALMKICSGSGRSRRWWKRIWRSGRPRDWCPIW